jgi:alpha-mannosidase/mannosylglycerate hydrolase
MGQTPTKRNAIYVLSTHWDREWYQPFQDYRWRLVKLMDHILAGLADGRLRGPFQTDGQAILIDDYLQVRPERRQQVRQLAAAGKLVIGPWYVLPDEFLVSGESLIRNLRYGRQRVRELGGKPSDAGFLCDMFGHCSQLPQIMAGFGVRVGFVWRGTNLKDTRLFRWRGADGTEMVCHRFGAGGYCAYASGVRRAGKHGEPFDAPALRQRIESALDNEAARTPVGPIMLFDGGDHLGWDEPAYKVLCEIMDDPAARHGVTHGSLDDYVAQLAGDMDKVQERLDGELREAGKFPADEDNQWVIPGVASSRVWSKQQNTQCETLLCQWAETWGAIAGAWIGREYPRGFLDEAWRWVLENHPHDSICGCSIDAVHQDVAYRFRQARQIAQRLTTETTRALAASVEGPIGEDELRLVVFNPLPRDLKQVVDLDLSIPGDWPAFNEFFGYENKPAFRVFTADGREVPYQRLAQSEGRRKFRTFLTRFPHNWAATDVSVAVEMSIPALGYTTLVIRKGERGLPTRHPATPSLITGPRSMANANLSVEVEQGGTLRLSDLKTGQAFSGLMAFEDGADIGDGWFWGIAVNDQVFTSGARGADVAVVHDGPDLATLRVRTVMSVPAEFCFESMRRSDRMSDLVIDSFVTLRRGADRVEVRSVVQNSVLDHRLRVLLPTGCGKATTYLADSAFDVVERPIALRADNHLCRELEVETRPQRGWCAVHQEGRGLAVLGAGLMESAVPDQPDRPIALTLLRATRRTVQTNGEPDGQLQGPQTFDYWIVPLMGRPDVTKLAEASQLQNAGVRASQIAAIDVPESHGQRDLAAGASFLRLDGPAVLSSLRQADRAMEARLYNPTGQTILAALCFDGQVAAPPATGQLVDFESRPIGPKAALKSGRYELSLGPKQVRTIRFDS